LSKKKKKNLARVAQNSVLLVFEIGQGDGDWSATSIRTEELVKVSY